MKFGRLVAQKTSYLLLYDTYVYLLTRFTDRCYESRKDSSPKSLLQTLRFLAASTSSHSSVLALPRQVASITFLPSFWVIKWIFAVVRQK